MHFGENQLSRSLIGLSPLSTGHPPSFQPRRVRSSTRSYPRFNLPMDRSLRFGSRWCNSGALFGLAFATATAHALTSLHHANSQAHSSKGTLSQSEDCSNGLYAHGFRYYFTPLPGYFSPFPHGTSPLSVTREYLGLAGGPARFTANSTGSLLLGVTLRRRRVFVYGGITHYAGPSQALRLTTTLSHSSPARQNQQNGPTTPHMQHLPAITHARFGLLRFRSPLLTESRLLSLPVGTEMFHFPTFPPLTLCVQVRVTGHDSCRVSPFGHPRITARSAAPRGLSQPPTSFIGSWCHGIYRATLLTWLHSILMLASTVKFSRYGRE